MASTAVPKLAAAFALGCAVALILAGSGGSRAQETARPTAAARPRAATPRSTAAARPGARPTAAARPRAAEPFPHTPAGAAAAATAWCQTTTEAFIDGGWDRAVDALTTGTFRAQARRYAPAAALVHRRLASAGTPYALRLWPLGYDVQQYSAASARVRVWQLYVLAIAAPEASTEFTTATVALQWTHGDWKVTAAPSGPDLPPPPADVTPNEVATWVGAVNQLRQYNYVP